MKILTTALSVEYGGVFFFTLLLVIIVLGAAVLFFALREKGDVKAQFSLRPLTWTLEAKDRAERVARTRE